MLIVVALFALLGHGYLWVGIVNCLHGGRLHGVLSGRFEGEPNHWLDRLARSRAFVSITTRFCWLGFVLLPGLIMWRWPPEGVGALTKLVWPSAGLSIYFYASAVWGVAKLLMLWLGKKIADLPDVLLVWRQEPVATDFLPGREVFLGRYPRLLARVPGNQALRLTIDFKQLKIPRLQAMHQGIRIAHISDLHMTGRLGLPWYEAVVQQVNQLQADIVAITGDIVEQQACWPWLSGCLAGLRAPCGVYFILGNHDTYIDSQQTRRLLAGAGLQCLSASMVKTAWRGAAVLLAGDERPWFPQVAAIEPISQPPVAHDGLRIALLHTPDQFSWACTQHFDLALAGHTHGGQLRLPILGPVACPSRYGTRYACGVFRDGNTVMHVSRGVSSKMPLRWNCPPEIALLELVSG
ncbi:MAG: metallophosphoesterase [Pirellulales bacterium]|nr:metallophosphoesterase [Pirellulales bacterium]